jgi:hypothetical protein
MELDKELPIFNVIRTFLETNDSQYLEITFNNEDGDHTEFEFNNFTNVFRSLKYKENIGTECLQVLVENNIMDITGMPKIVQYCASNDSFDKNTTSFYKKTNIASENARGLFDLNVTASIYNNTNTPIPENWEEIRKKYYFKKEFSYEKNSIIYVANLFKTSDEEFYSLKQSGVLKSNQRYSFKIRINKSDKQSESTIIQAIYLMIQSIMMSSMILTKAQQQIILNEYYELIKNDVKVFHKKDNKNEIPLITPKPSTLERKNMIDPREYGSVSILSGYTVTEKADGERILFYVNNVGKAYLINNTYRVQDTGITITSKSGHNSLVDGEYIICDKRKDFSDQNLYAAFDIYYVGGKKVTSLPLMGDKESRYKYMKEFEKLIPKNKDAVEFIVKEHKYSDDILSDSKDILSNKEFPYEVDGLIFTPAKLALYSYYANNPVQITNNVSWDRVFKWKPVEQNTIDFIVKIDKTIIKDGIKYKEAKLYIAYNPLRWEDIDIATGLKLRYDKKFRYEFDSRVKYVPILFRPEIYYQPGIEYAHIRHNNKGEIRAENGDLIESNSVVEFRYINDTTIPVNDRWKATRVREDKTRIYNKGILSKTANDKEVALNIWRSIHAPVTTSMIIGNEPVMNHNGSDDKQLEADDIYYSRNILREYLLSVHMNNFHNQGIKQMLYNYPKKKGNLLELCCGEGGDMVRWIDAGYSFVLGIDFVKNNIYNPRSGAYARMKTKMSKFMHENKQQNRENVYFPNFVFAAGDCSASIRNGNAAAVIDDKDSEKLLKQVMNRQSYKESYMKHITGKGANGFDAISCMFAIHYFFESETKLDGFLLNVSQNLKKDGVFFCTFMNGDRVESELNKNGGDVIEGIKLKTETDKGMPVWAIIRRFNKDNLSEYGKQIDVYIENTQKLIPEYLISFNLLVERAKEHGLILEKSEMFEERFQKLKNEIPESEENHTNIHQSIINLDADEVQKKFSFFNQWAVFKKM